VISLYLMTTALVKNIGKTVGRDLPFP